MSRISIISPGVTGGGAERVANILAEYFSLKGHQVCFIYMRSDESWLNERCSVQYICVDNHELHGIRKYIYKASKTWHHVKEHNSDVVISFLTDEALITMLMFRGRKISSLRNDPKRTCTKIYTKMIRYIVYSASNCVVFQTTDARDFFSGKIKRKGVIIPNPITSNLPKWLDQPEHANVITACRLEPQKNLKMLMDAFNKISLEGYLGKLLVYGEGILKAELEKYASEKLKNDHIIFKGYSNNIHEEMKNASVFALTSDYEGISNSMLEAIAIGVPTVCTDCPVGGAKMAIGKNERGILIPVGETEKLYYALKKLLYDVEFCIDLSTKEMTIREELNIQTVCKKWERLME